MESATSGERRSRSRRLGNGRMGRSGNRDETLSGDILSKRPVQRRRRRRNVSPATKTSKADTIIMKTMIFEGCQRRDRWLAFPLFSETVVRLETSILLCESDMTRNGGAEQKEGTKEVSIGERRCHLGRIVVKKVCHTHHISWAPSRDATRQLALSAGLVWEVMLLGRCLYLSKT